MKDSNNSTATEIFPSNNGYLQCFATLEEAIADFKRLQQANYTPSLWFLNLDRPSYWCRFGDDEGDEFENEDQEDTTEDSEPSLPFAVTDDRLIEINNPMLDYLFTDCRLLSRNSLEEAEWFTTLSNEEFQALVAVDEDAFESALRNRRNI